MGRGTREESPREPRTGRWDPRREPRRRWRRRRCVRGRARASTRASRRASGGGAERASSRCCFFPSRLLRDSSPRLTLSLTLPSPACPRDAREEDASEPERAQGTRPRRFRARDASRPPRERERRAHREASFPQNADRVFVPDDRSLRRARLYETFQAASATRLRRCSSEIVEATSFSHQSTRKKRSLSQKRREAARRPWRHAR